MSDPLLPYYNRELAFLRKMGAEFAQAHPKIAGRMAISQDGRTEDPHVSRMIEAFAYLNARTRHKIEDELPEVTEGLLGILYPHYLAPVPSSAIIQLTLHPEHAELTTGHTIDRGAVVETEPIDGQPCRFRTCYPVTLWPLRVVEAGIHEPPLPAPDVRLGEDIASVVRLSLDCFSKKVSCRQISPQKLRFFLDGDSPYIYDLYELLFNHTIGVAVATAPDSSDVVMLDRECLKPVGFDRDEGLLDYSARSFLGYRLLSEHFAFPEKFLFFDIEGLSSRVMERLRDKPHFEIFIYLDRHLQDLERNVTRDTFRLGCCPMVNLFRHRAEPIHLTHTKTEYRIVPDARRPLAHEIHSVDRVTATSPDDEKIEYEPFYSVQHHGSTNEQRKWWYAARRPAGYAGGEVDSGTEVYLSLVDLDFRPSAPAEWTVDVETTCLNRNLPGRLTFGGGEPRLRLPEGGALANATCLTRPTLTLRPESGRGTLWRLISHLSLNHLSLVNDHDGGEALREIVGLYNPTNSAETEKMIEGILNVESRRIVGRVGGPVSAGFCRGVEVTVHFDEEKFTGGGLYLLASVLDRFFALYSSLNSFTKTIATTNRSEGQFAQWAPRAGERVLI